MHTVETFIFLFLLILIPGQLWKIILSQLGYHLKTISTRITAAKQTVGNQRTIVVEELGKHLEASRRMPPFALEFRSRSSTTIGSFEVCVINKDRYSSTLKQFK